MKSIQDYTENFTEPENINDYFQDMEVTQIARTGKLGEAKPLKSYKFFSVWPSSVSAIDLDFGNNDSIEEFTVELQVQYWKPTS